MGSTLIMMMKVCLKLIICHGKSRFSIKTVVENRSLQLVARVLAVHSSKASFSSSIEKEKDNLVKGNSTKGMDDDWQWIPPVRFRDDDGAALKTRRHKLTVIENQLPTVNELLVYLQEVGGEDVRSISLDPPLVNINHFLFASFQSVRLIRQAASNIKDNLKERKLLSPTSANVIEGDKDDEWQIVDCQETVVHLMTPETRERMDLETHWTMKSRPHLQFTGSEEERDRDFENLLEKYPAVPLKESELPDDKGGKQYNGYDRTIDVL